MVRISEIGTGSIAEELDLRIGSRIVRVNGALVRDSLDFHFLTAEDDLVLEAVSPDGDKLLVQIARDGSQRLGIVPERDKVRECANECIFCFIDGNPPDAREALWIRDDDFRLSFTYGNYVTLTNLGPRGLQRLIDQRISPLYVSVHATNPELRSRLLKNERAGLILEQLHRLLEAGLEVHTQIVLCPEWNDGSELDRTIADLFALGSGVLTLSVVPVGLTRYNLNRPVRLLREDEAQAAIAQVARARHLAASERKHSWCYAADELFLIAAQDVPESSYYDEWSLLENGVGALRSFVDDFSTSHSRLAPAAGVARLRIITGGSMAPVVRRLVPLVAKRMDCSVEVIEVSNSYFGPTVTIAGLLAGADILGAIGESRSSDLVLLPADALNAADVFIDGVALTEVKRHLSPAKLHVGHHLVDTILQTEAPLRATAANVG